jgi:hypothetical protein
VYLQEFVVAGDWATTGGANPKPFLVYDNGTTSRERVVVFATKDALRHLAQSQVWFMDGNFSMAPLLFQQLYIIRAQLDDGAVTCVYALLSGKTQAIYEVVFRVSGR